MPTGDEQGWVEVSILRSSQNLQVHHKTFRSQQGSDDDSNLITLCAGCHAQLHGSRNANCG